MTTKDSQEQFPGEELSHKYPALFVRLFVAAAATVYPLNSGELKARNSVSLVPRLSPRASEKSKERGEPGRIYHMRNVIGRENLITCGQTNEFAHAVRTECSCDSFMADRMGLDGTMLHYLAVRKAMVEIIYCRCHKLCYSI